MAVVTVGGLLIMKGQMDTVDLLTFTLYIASFVNPIRKLANFTELFSNGTAGFERFWRSCAPRRSCTTRRTRLS